MIVHKELQKQATDQLYSTHMEIREMRFLGHESICWVGINADIETHIKLFNMS